MPLLIRSIGSSVNRLPLPTVGVTTLPSGQKRWTKLSDELKVYYRQVAAEAINDFTMRIARLSLAEVPKGPHYDEEGRLFHPTDRGAGEGTLAGSIHHPDNDPSCAAHWEYDYMSAAIYYDSPYAHVQHEGEAIMQHHYQMVETNEGWRELKSRPAEIEIAWKAEAYTTPGTKDHFLSDPMKRYMPGMEEFVGRRVRERLQLG